MKRFSTIFAVFILLEVFAATTQADVLIAVDSFGTGANQFSIDFVPISNSTNPSSGYGIVDYDYRMGVFEITNDQWNKFTASLGVSVTGSQEGYSYSSYFTGTNVPTDNVSWYEAAQFINWLNTSTGHQAAYKFTGTQGTGDYTFAMWESSDAWGETNLYRHKDAYYFLPNEDEWFKAAYWNGTTIQDYTTRPGDTLHQGDGVNGTGWNYYDTSLPSGPWNVGSGSEELNGTYDMMGNNREWVESPFIIQDYTLGSWRGMRGGTWDNNSTYLVARASIYTPPTNESIRVGFRVASVPEPSTITLSLCVLASVAIIRRR
ncbi:MAG: SUMF1/EgtB/PvdO family nonheme iron enzyme [Pirellulales bacterium]|nr:SUMF1/EgtB/PvdO family nonheme iron enzyme [Pirellulales bacterium]